MTPYEMRQQAYRYRREANVLEESAQVLRSVAASVRGLLSGIAGISRMVWQGPAATEFEQEAEVQSRKLDGQADEVSGEAGGFDSKAASLRSTATWLLHEAARIEAEQAVTVPPNVS